MSDAIYYVYGVTPPALDLTRAPEGLDGGALGLEAEGSLGALVSRLDPSAYAPEVVEARTSDVEWLGPRAVAHDRVLTWASDPSASIPSAPPSSPSGAPARSRAGGVTPYT